MKKTRCYTFSDPEVITSGMELMALFACGYNGHYYEPPISIDTLGRDFCRFTYLRSALQVKINILYGSWVPHPLMTRPLLKRLLTDYMWYGNAYLQRITSRTGRVLSLDVPLAKFTRRDKNQRYKYIARDNADPFGGAIGIMNFPPGSIYQLQQPDVNQEIYGIPEWLPAFISAKLNEAATMFRQRYYLNGSHAGYIIYLSDPNITEDDKEEIIDTLKSSKGPGNFRNILIDAPNGEKDGIKLIPLSETQAKDEFFNVKSISRDDQLAACRVPPNIMGIIPQNTGGFGSITDAAAVFTKNEVEPLQKEFAQLNDWLGEPVFTFNPYVITTPQAGAD